MTRLMHHRPNCVGFTSLQGIVGAMLFVAASAPLAALAQASPSAFTYATRYDEEHRVTGTISPDPDGAGALHYPAVRNTYDAAGRLIRVEKGELASWQPEVGQLGGVAPESWSGFTVFSQVNTTYDSMDRKVTETHSSGGTSFERTQYSYDSVGRLDCTAVRMDPAQWASQTDACTPQLNGPSGPDRITRNVYDAAGQLLQVRRAVGTPLEQAYATYSYTPNGKQQYVIDANGNRAQMVYDGFDRQVQWIFPSPSAPTAFDGSTQATALATAGAINTGDYEQYSYDANGNRTSLRKRDGSTLGYSYDALNRVIQKTVPSRAGLPSTATRSVYYGYDLRGLQVYARFDGSSGEGVTNAWDGFGRQLSSTLTMDGVSRAVSYQYDADGNRTQVTLPDVNFTTYVYDSLDRPTSILRSGSAAIASYTYNAAGQRDGFNGGVNTAYGHDGIGRVTSISNTLPNAAYNNSYGFDYNSASQITQLTKSNNLFAFADTYNVERGYAVNGLNQYSGVGSAKFQYDANGNLICDGTITDASGNLKCDASKSGFVYDIENRLVSAYGSRAATLRYDPLGRLYETSGSSGTIRFLYDGDALAGEYDANGNLLRRYVHGADGAADDPIAWYEGPSFTGTNERILRPDWQGSIALIADTTGSNVFAVNTYDEYGIPGRNNLGRLQYTGQAWQPDLGMYYYKARFYSPNLGRFLQTDPIGYKDQVNLYAYVANDPVNNKDPDGEELIGALVGAATGAGLDYATQVLGNLAEGKSVRESLTDVDGKSIIISGVTGGIAGATGIGTTTLVGKFFKAERAAVRARDAYVKAKAGARLGYGTARMVRLSQQAARAARASETTGSAVKRAIVAAAALKAGEKVAKEVEDRKKE